MVSPSLSIWASRSKSTKLSFSGVTSVSASECATWLSRVCEPGQSIRMKSLSGSSVATAAESL